MSVSPTLDAHLVLDVIVGINPIAASSLVLQRTVESGVVIQEDSVHLEGNFVALTEGDSPTELSLVGCVLSLVRGPLLKVHENAVEEASWSLGGVYSICRLREEHPIFGVEDLYGLNDCLASAVVQGDVFQS